MRATSKDGGAHACHLVWPRVPPDCTQHPPGITAKLRTAALTTIFTPLLALCALFGVLWGLCLAAWTVTCAVASGAAWSGGSLLLLGGKLARDTAAVVWRGLLFGAVTMPVAAEARLLRRLRQARTEVLGAAAAGVKLEEEGEEEEVESEGKTNNVTKAARGLTAKNRRVAKATPLAGRRRRASAAAQKQNKVWDPGRGGHYGQ